MSIWNQSRRRCTIDLEPDRRPIALWGAVFAYRRSDGSGQDLVWPGTHLTAWRMRSRWCAAADMVTIAAATVLIAAVAVDVVGSWPANHVLISDPVMSGFAAIVLAPCWPWLLVSALMVYGVPRRGSRTPAAHHLARARWPRSWRFGLSLTVLVSLGVLVGGFMTGAGEGATRVVAGGRYEVSTLDLHNSGWTVVSPAQFRFWEASFVREDAMFTLFAVALIAGGLGFLHRHRMTRLSAAGLDPTTLARGSIQ